MKDIFSEIYNKSSSIKESDIDNWIVPMLVDFFSIKISNMSYTIYGNSTIAKSAFLEYAKETIRTSVYTFMFVSEHWRTNRDLKTYILTSLNRLKLNINSNLNFNKKIQAPICPACKFFGQKEYHFLDGKDLKCKACEVSISNIENDILLLKKNKSNDSNNLNFLELKLNLCKAFSSHSKKGYRCPDCERFLPNSYLNSNGINCPYYDCSFFGNKNELELMQHPTSIRYIKSIPIDDKLSDNNPNYYLEPYNNRSLNSNSYKDFLKCESNVFQTDNLLLIKEDYYKEYNLLYEVINNQMSNIRGSNDKSFFIRKTMYQAYKNILEKYPQDMISYLVHRKHGGGLPIQSVIFQEYIRIVEGNLPLTFNIKNKKIDIFSLEDKNLNLFKGISEFTTVVNNNYIPNKTKEKYIGGRKLKDFGRCFIGKLINVIDLETNQSILNHVDRYSFMKIILNKEIDFHELPVKVIHYRLLPHYEIGSLVPLQRIRKKIVDSVYFRLHGKKRIIK